jgi:site-specific DNA recombinase
VIESATEQIDTTTSTGRFTRGMLAEMAAFEAERIGDTWREAHSRRVRMGLPKDGKPRFGYRVTDGGSSPTRSSARCWPRCTGAT